MKMACNQNSMFKMLHPSATEIYNTCTSLKIVCESIADPNFLSKEISTIQPFAPV